MLYFGKEEPTTNNGALFEREKHSKKIILDRSKGTALNRYTIILKKEAHETFSNLLSFVSREINLPLHASSVWMKNFPSRSPVAARVIEKDYLKNGWKVYNQLNYYHAVSSQLNKESKILPMINKHPSKTGEVFFFSNDKDFEPRCYINEERAIFLAKNKGFTPDNSLLKSIEKKDAYLAYEIKDDRGNVGVVIIGRKKLNIKSSKYGEIKIFENDEAYKAIVLNP